MTEKAIPRTREDSPEYKSSIARRNTVTNSRKAAELDVGNMMMQKVVVQLPGNSWPVWLRFEPDLGINRFPST